MQASPLVPVVPHAHAHAFHAYILSCREAAQSQWGSRISQEGSGMAQPEGENDDDNDKGHCNIDMII